MKIEVSEATYQLLLEAQEKKGLSSLSVTLAELALEFLRKGREEAENHVEK